MEKSTMEEFREYISNLMENIEDRLKTHVTDNFITLNQRIEDLKELLEKCEVAKMLLQIIERQEKFEETLDKNYRHINEMQKEMKGIVSMARVAVCERKNQDK